MALKSGKKDPAIVSPGDATCDVPGLDATCDLPGATCDLPGATIDRPAPDGGTCDFAPPEGASATSGGRYRPETLARQAGGATRDNEPSRDATGEFRPETGAIPGDATGAFLPGDASAEQGRRTSNRQAGELTNPGSVGAFTPDVSEGRAGRYYLKKFHAKGGMGEVWLAEDSDLGRPVALKRMLKGRESQKEQFLQEAQVTGQLEHPGVVPVHELSLDENGQPYYVMKFVDGQTLKRVIEDFHAGTGDTTAPREVRWLRLLNVFLDLCQTMAYAHSRGVIHRDIKPENVMVGAYGETLVLDWGLAKVIGKPESMDPYAAVRLSGDDSMATMAGSVKGTPRYFSPEVAQGKVDEVDQVSDVYLLGATLYQILTGKPPREGKKLKELLHIAATEQPASPRKHDHAIPKALEAVCMKAIAFQKKDRYPTAAALAEDMQSYLAGEPVSAYQETLMERAWRFVKRHRVVLSRTAAGLVIALVGVTAFVLIRNAQEERAAALLLAGELASKDKARVEINRFRALAEEARFYSASASPAAEAAPSLDPGKAQSKANAALAIADAWGPDLAELPLDEPKPALKKDLYDLLIEMVNLKSRGPDAWQARENSALLDRAAGLQTPTQSYYRLRARSLEWLGKKDEADAAEKRVLDPSTPATAIDHYLEGDRLRQESSILARDIPKEGKKEGLKALELRQAALGKSAAAYRRALDSDPNHYWSHYALGDCYLALGDYTAAVEAFGTCVALRPDAPWSYTARSLALVHISGREADAHADLARALKLDPEFRPAQLQRGSVALKEKDYDAAEADFTALLSLPEDKRMLEAAFLRGQTYMERGESDKALADFDFVVENRLPFRTVYLHRARMHMVKQMPEKALKDLTTFLAVGKSFDPESAEAYELRGHELRILASEFDKARNRKEETYLLALQQLKTAVKKGRNTPSVFFELGLVGENLAGLRSKEALSLILQAIEAYSKGLELEPEHVRLLIKRGGSYVNLNQNQEAAEDYAAAIAADRENAEAYAGLGYARALLKQPASARRCVGQAVLFGAGDYLVLHNAACIFGALSKVEAARATEYQDQAIDLLARAIELWEKGGRNGPNELLLIRNETAFPPALQNRPEFRKLLGE